MYKHDRYAVDLQAMIYYMMREACVKYYKKVNLAQAQKQPEPNAEFLAHFEPSFVHEPYYEQILSMLKDLSKPEHIIV